MFRIIQTLEAITTEGKWVSCMSNIACCEDEEAAEAFTVYCDQSLNEYTRQVAFEKVAVGEKEFNRNVEKETEIAHSSIWRNYKANYYSAIRIRSRKTLEEMDEYSRRVVWDWR